MQAFYGSSVMRVEDLELKGIKLIHPKIFRDDRGFFLESYHRDRYKEYGIDVEFVQDNHSYSSQGTIRGMHFQSNPGQAKLVSVSHGSIYDVIVDMRKTSKTYKQWIGVTLSGNNPSQIFIPVGFAHGFCVLSENAHVHYKVSSYYHPDTEKGFHFLDKEINITWPCHHPIVSLRDQNAPQFCEV